MKENIKELVSTNLKKARTAKGMTQKEIAYLLNMQQTVYSRFETMRTELDYDKIYKICIILDITPNDLFGF